MSYFLVSLEYSFLLFLLGAAPAALLCPRPLRPYALTLSPIVGFSILTFTGWYSYFLGLSGTDSYGCWLLAGSFLPSASCFYIIGKRGLSRRDFECRPLLPVYVLATLAFITLSLPIVLSHPDYLTSISLANNDLAEMAGISTFLQHFERGSNAGFLGQSAIWQWNADHSVFGGAFSAAFFSTIAGLEPYQVQSMILNVFFSISIPLVYAITVELLRFSQSRALLVTVIFALNPVFIYVVYQGYMGQTLTTTISAAVTLVLGAALHHGNTLRKVLSFVPLAVLASWALMVSYPHMLPFALAPLLVFSVSRSFVERTLIPIGSYFLLVGVTLLALTAMSPQRVYAVYSELVRVKGGDLGWFIPLQWPDMFLGLSFSLDFEYRPFVFHAILSGALVGAFCVGGIKQWYSDREAVLFSLSALCVTLGGVLVLAVREMHEPIPGGYRSFKLLSFFMPIIIPCAFLWFKLNSTGSSYKQWVIPTLSSVIIAANGCNTAALIRHVVDHHKAVERDLVDLRRLSANPKIESVNMLLSRDWWQILWANQFLVSVKQFFELPAYDGRNPGPLDGKYDLRRLKDYEHGDIYHFDVARGNLDVVERESMIPVNSSFGLAPRSRYRIVPAPPTHKTFSAHVSIGPDASEPGKNKLELSLDIGRTRAYADFRIKSRGGGRDRRRPVLWNNEPLALEKRFGIGILDDFPLRPGHHVMVLPLGTASTAADGYEFLDVVLRPASSTE